MRGQVTSRDGTAIAYDRAGSGPAVVLVGGGLDDGSENAPLAAELARSFTVFNYARRGRGESGDTPPHAVDREIEDLEALVADGRRGDALELLLRVTDTPEEHIAGMRGSSYWPAMEALAHTLPYDAACLGDGRPPALLARVRQPVLVATGGPHQPDAATWVRALDPAADAMAARIPNAERRVLEGQSHVPEPNALAAVLERFFAR